MVRLFPDYRAREQDYFRRTKIFPIMHLIVIRNEVYERHPEVAASLYQALNAAKDRAWERMRFSGTLRYMLPWLPDDVAEIDEIFGGDCWPYGVEPNRPTLEALVTYMVEQGLIPERIPVEKLFVPTKAAPEQAVRGKSADKSPGASRFGLRQGRAELRHLIAAAEEAAPVDIMRDDELAAVLGIAGRVRCGRDLQALFDIDGGLLGADGIAARRVRRVRPCRQRAGAQRIGFADAGFVGAAFVAVSEPGVLGHGHGIAIVVIGVRYSGRDRVELGLESTPPAPDRGREARSSSCRCADY